MNENIRKILERLVADDADVVFDGEYCECQCCSAKGFTPASVKHEPDCIVTLAKNELQKEASDATERKQNFSLQLSLIIARAKELPRPIDAQKVNAIKNLYNVMPVQTRSLKAAKDLIVEYWDAYKEKR